MRQKTGGRKANTPNRINAEAKEVIQNLVNSEVIKISDLLEKLSPKDRLEIVIKLIAFVVPKQTKLQLEADESRFNPVIINLGSGINPEAEPLKLEQ